MSGAKNQISDVVGPEWGRMECKGELGDLLG